MSSFLSVYIDSLAMRQWNQSVVRIEHLTWQQTFHHHAAEKVSVIAKRFHEMELAYKRVCNMFGESYKQIEPDVFFGIIHSFIESFKVR